MPAMKKTKLKQTEIAERVGTHKVYINAILRGRRRPSPDMALRIVEATGGEITVMELLFPGNQKKGEPSDSGNGSAT